MVPMYVSTPFAPPTIVGMTTALAPASSATRCASFRSFQGWTRMGIVVTARSLWQPSASERERPSTMNPLSARARAPITSPHRRDQGVDVVVDGPDVPVRPLRPAHHRLDDNGLGARLVGHARR